MIKNEHLIPVNIIDLVDKFSKTNNQNEKLNYQFRLEAIRDYCDEVLKKNLSSLPIDHTKNKMFVRKK